MVSWSRGSVQLVWRVMWLAKNRCRVSWSISSSHSAGNGSIPGRSCASLAVSPSAPVRLPDGVEVCGPSVVVEVFNIELSRSSVFCRM